MAGGGLKYHQLQRPSQLHLTSRFSPPFHQFMLNRDQFLREIEQRENLDPRYVIDIIAHSPLEQQDNERAANEEEEENEEEREEREAREEREVAAGGKVLKKWGKDVRKFDLYVGPRAKRRASEASPSPPSALSPTHLPTPPTGDEYATNRRMNHHHQLHRPNPTQTSHP